MSEAERGATRLAARGEAAEPPEYGVLRLLADAIHMASILAVSAIALMAVVDAWPSSPRRVAATIFGGGLVVALGRALTRSPRVVRDP